MPDYYFSLNFTNLSLTSIYLLLPTCHPTLRMRNVSPATQLLFLLATLHFLQNMRLVGGEPKLIIFLNKVCTIDDFNMANSWPSNSKRML